MTDLIDEIRMLFVVKDQDKFNEDAISILLQLADKIAKLESATVDD